MAVVAGFLFFLAALLAPRKGILSRLRYQQQLALRVMGEDILGMLFRLEEAGSQGRHLSTNESLEKALAVGPLQRWLAVAGLRSRGFIEAYESGWRLTEAGRDKARRLVRSHRMWELYLHQHLDLPVDHLHSTAHRLEHTSDPDQRAALERELGHPEQDPHGKPIPPE
ncbi:MAG: hypothetical protein KC983_01330 [Phycisphaerales bacterium]|nr:hypothetical protein [Phycisphaerales bacterium]